MISKKRVRIASQMKSSKGKLPSQKSNFQKKTTSMFPLSGRRIIPTAFRNSEWQPGPILEDEQKYGRWNSRNCVKTQLEFLWKHFNDDCSGWNLWIRSLQYRNVWYLKCLLNIEQSKCHKKRTYLQFGIEQTNPSKQEAVNTGDEPCGKSELLYIYHSISSHHLTAGHYLQHPTVSHFLFVPWILIQVIFTWKNRLMQLPLKLLSLCSLKAMLQVTPLVELVFFIFMAPAK